MQEGIRIAVLAQILADLAIAEPRPAMACDQYIRLAEHAQRIRQTFGPHFRVAHHGAAWRQDVVLRRVGVFRHVHDLPVGEPHIHFRRRFRARRELKHHVHAVDGQRLARRSDLPRRRDQRGGAGRQPRPDPRIDETILALRQLGSELVHRAPLHRRPSDHVLAHGCIEETLGRNHLDLAGAHILERYQPRRACEVIRVRVRVDHGHHRPRPKLFVRQLQRRLGRLVRTERVDDDPARRALHEGDVGEVKPAHLPDGLAHLIEPVPAHQLALPPEAGVHRFGRGFLQEVERRKVPHHLSACGGDLRVLTRGHKSALREREVLRIGKVARRQHPGVFGLREGRRRLRSSKRSRQGRRRHWSGFNARTPRNQHHAQPGNQ